ncbi:conserved hypothetical protein [Pseudoclavibacter sp. 8L]|nr:conserved hypothetical protein [Pseudoclavibacter sp. 8L]
MRFGAAAAASSHNAVAGGRDVQVPRGDTGEDAHVRILLKLELDCPTELLADALQRPEAFRAVAGPLAEVRSLEPGGFPERWSPERPHRVEIRLLGMVPLGTQVIDGQYRDLGNGMHELRDRGYPESGLMAVMTTFEHTMVVSPLPGGRTLYRDQLELGAGLLTPFVWFGMWMFWQKRAFSMRQLADRLRNGQ